MLQAIKVFLPLGGFSLSLLALVLLSACGVKLMTNAYDVYRSTLLIMAYSLVILSIKLGFWLVGLGSYESSAALIIVLFVHSVVLIFYKIYLFPLAVLLSCILYSFNIYNSAIFSLYTVDGLTLLLCSVILLVYKFKKTP